MKHWIYLCLVLFTGFMMSCSNATGDQSSSVLEEDASNTETSTTSTKRNKKTKKTGTTSSGSKSGKSSTSINNTKVGAISYRIPESTLCADQFDTSCLDETDAAIATISQIEDQARNLIEVTLEEEKEAGKQFHDNVTFHYVNDSRTRKLENILERMRPHTQRKEIDYKIYLIAEDVVNAWAVPGGAIYVTTGMMDFVESDHELANVIGHEIGHNECKHTLKFLQRAKPVEDLSNLFESVTGVKVETDEINAILNIPTMAFGQKDELQADRTGFYLANKLGYDPLIGLDFWKRLAKNETENDIDKLFRSHPYSSTRYECGRNFINTHKKD